MHQIDKTKKFIQQEKKAILIIGFLMAISCVMAYFTLQRFGKIGTDYALYAIIGKNFIEGKGFTLWGVPHTIFSPLHPIFIGIFYFFVKNLELAAHLSTIAFALASLPLVYYTIKSVYSEKAALIGLLLYTFCGHIVMAYSVLPTPQIPASFFSLVVFLSLVKLSALDNTKYKIILFWSFIAGFATALGYLVRPEYFFSIIPVVIFLFFLLFKKIPPQKIFLILATTIIGFLIAALPYLIFLRAELGTWTISGRSSETSLILGGKSYEGPEDFDSQVNETAIVTPPKEGGSMMAGLMSNIIPTLKNFMDNLSNNYIAFGKILGLVGICFFAYGLREILILKNFPILFAFFVSLQPLLFISVIIEGGKPNYLTQFIYLFIVFMAIGFVSFKKEVIDDLFQDKIRRNAFFYSILTFQILFTIFFPLLQHFLFHPLSGKPQELKDLGLWMKDNIEDVGREIVIARKPDVSFYAEAEWLLLPPVKNIEDLKIIMKNKLAKFVVADDRAKSGDRKEIIEELETKGIKYGFVEIKSFEYFGNNTTLFKLEYDKE